MPAQRAFWKRLGLGFISLTLTTILVVSALALLALSGL